MCMIAGYNGNKEAAPILIEMMRKQEGLDGGFFTGIATFHEGKIYYAKACGDLEHLLATTNAAELPGTMGIIHSRTPGGSQNTTFCVPDCWAHPFTCEKDGEAQAALVMNGCGGIFKGTFNVAEIAEGLIAEGYEMKSRLPDAGNTLLSDGSRVHSTDVRCQLTAQKINSGMDAADAVEETFTEMPGESVGLLLSLTEPDAISFARLVMPMHVATVEHGTYMATAPLAFIDDATEYTLLPTMSSGKVYRDGFTARKFKNPPATVAPITPEVMKVAYEYLEEAFKTPRTVFDTGLDLKEVYPAADCTQRGTVVYQVISELYRQGRLKIESRYIPGKVEGLRAPKFYLSIK